MGLPSTIGSQFHRTGCQIYSTASVESILVRKSWQYRTIHKIVVRDLTYLGNRSSPSSDSLLTQRQKLRKYKKVWLRLIYRVTSNLSYKQLTEDRGERVSIFIAQSVLFPSPSRFIHGKLQLLIRRFYLRLTPGSPFI